MDLKFKFFEGNLLKYTVAVLIILVISIPAILSVRHKYELKQSAMDVVTAIKKAQNEAINRKESVALAIDHAHGTCTAFVDDGAVSYQKAKKLPLTPQNADNLRLDPNEKVLFKVRIHRIDVVENDREHPFPKTEAVLTAAGKLVGGIVIDGKVHAGVQFNAKGLPTNLGTETQYKPCQGSAVTGFFSVLDVKSKTNPIDRYQVAVNASTGKVLLLVSTNGGECYH